nr:IS630 family transposase [Sphingomonas sp. CDS-1]
MGWEAIGSLVMSTTKLVLIELSIDERKALEQRVRRRSTSRRDAQRAEIVLRAADGANNCKIAAAVGVTRKTVRAWRARFAEQRMDGLSDEPRCGAPRRIDDDRIKVIIAKTLEEKPVNAKHWNIRDIAKAAGVSTSSVYRIGRAFSLQQNCAETSRLSSDPQFIEKVRDIVGLFLDPPDKALAICVDERNQNQALGRTQALVPMRPGQIERRAHDYERHGMTTLFAGFQASVSAQAMVRPGEAIDRCDPCHRSSEFRAFLEELEHNVPAELDVHVVMNIAESHKTKMFGDWFVKRPHWHMHFTPTSSSWLDQVERFFTLLSEKRIKRGADGSVKALIEVIEIFIDNHNANPKPLRWTKSANNILASTGRRYRRTLDARPKAG